MDSEFICEVNFFVRDFTQINLCEIFIISYNISYQACRYDIINAEDGNENETVANWADMIPAISMAYEEAESDIMKRMPRKMTCCWCALFGRDWLLLVHILRIGQ